MADRFITITIAAADQNLAQSLAAAMDETGLFTAAVFYVEQGFKNDITGPLHNPGDKVAYISTGSVNDIFVDAWLRGPGPILTAALAAGWTGNIPDVATMWNNFYCDVSEDTPENVMARLGVSIVDPNAEA